MKRVIAVLDLPPRRSLPNVRASFQAAATRWNAEVIWITNPLHSCHPFWQKMFVCDHVQSLFGSSHVLQLDNDMVIRSDCPSPFDLVPTTDFAMVSGRQSSQRRVDRASWNQMAHEEWARRCDVIAAPAWTHPNGGLYLYGTETFGTMFAEIISHLLPTGGKHDLGCDECLIVNQLWTYHRSAIRFLPADYNVNLHQNDCWVSNPVMQSFIYHFVARTKERLPEVRWQRTDPVELPYPWDKRSRAIVDDWGNRPPDSFSLENITQVETAANLLTACPNLQITVACSQDSQLGSCDAIRNHDRCGQFAATHTSYLNLIRLLLRLGPNASRIVPNETPLAMLSQQLGVKAIDQTCHRHRETRGKGVHAMSKKPKEIDFRKEAEDQLNAIRSRIGQEVPLSNRYVRGQRAILVSVDGETATLKFPNGATLANVPLRDLVDDSGYWKP